MEGVSCQGLTSPVTWWGSKTLVAVSAAGVNGAGGGAGRCGMKGTRECML